MFKRYDKRTLRLIYNIVDAVGSDGFNDEENINYMVSQAIPIFNKNWDDKKLEKMSDRQKQSLKNQTVEKINECLKQYGEYRKIRENMEKIAISWDGKDYISKYINIENYFYINNRLRNGEGDGIAEDVLFMLFDGICPIDVFMDIKVNDPIYYELIIDDVSTLIYKTIDEILKIKSVSKKNGSGSLINYIPKDTKSDIYALFLENYNITPEQVNKCKAIDVLKALAEISKKQVVRDAEEQAKNIPDKFMQSAYIAQVLEEIGEGDE